MVRRFQLPSAAALVRARRTWAVATAALVALPAVIVASAAADVPLPTTPSDPAPTTPVTPGALSSSATTPEGPPAPTTPAAPPVVAPSTPALVDAAGLFSVAARPLVDGRGAITLTVRSLAAGKFTSFATVPANAAITDDDDAAIADPGDPLAYGTGLASPRVGQRTSLTYRPGKAGRSALAALHGSRTLAVTIHTWFQSPGSPLRRATTHLTMRLQPAGLGASASRVARRYVIVAWSA